MLICAQCHATAFVFFLFWLRLHLSNSLCREFFCPFSLHADCFMLRRKKGKESKSEECRSDMMSTSRPPLPPLFGYQYYKSTFIRGGHRGEVEEIGGRRQPKLLFTTLFWRAEYKQVSEDLEFLTSTLYHPVFSTTARRPRAKPARHSDRASN